MIEGFETSAISTVMPGNYPKENILHIEHSESLKLGVYSLMLAGGCRNVWEGGNCVFIYIVCSNFGFINKYRAIAGN